MAEQLSTILRTLAEWLRVPVLVVLVLMLAVTVIAFGSLVAERATERRRIKGSFPKLVDALRDDAAALTETIEHSGLLKRQKRALLELASHPSLTPVMREALARKLLSDEQKHYNGTLRVTDVIVKVGPMFGLLGTLIPLGPGLIALGQGDTYTLSQSLLSAFDTTIAGLSAAAVCFVISGIRRSWYNSDITALESLMECVLEREEQA